MYLTSCDILENLRILEFFTGDAVEAREAAKKSGVSGSRHNFITECYFLAAFAFHVGYP